MLAPRLHCVFVFVCLEYGNDCLIILILTMLFASGWILQRWTRDFSKFSFLIFKLDFLGWNWSMELYTFQIYIFIIHDLNIAFVRPLLKAKSFPLPYIWPPLLLLPLSTPFPLNNYHTVICAYEFCWVLHSTLYIISAPKTFLEHKPLCHIQGEAQWMLIRNILWRKFIHQNKLDLGEL